MGKMTELKGRGNNFYINLAWCKCLGMGKSQITLNKLLSDLLEQSHPRNGGWNLAVLAGF